MKSLIRILCLGVVMAIGSMTMTGCHTMEGIGHDLSAAGQGLADVASDINPAND